MKNKNSIDETREQFTNLILISYVMDLWYKLILTFDTPFLEEGKMRDFLII